MIVNIRPIQPKDLKRLMKVEQASFPEPWEEQDFRGSLSQNKNTGLLAEVHGQIIGYIIYTQEIEQYTIISLAVAPEFRKQGVGRMLVERVILNLRPECRSVIGVVASDTNLECHLFLRKLGFKAACVVRNFFGPGHDGYDFAYNAGTPYKKIDSNKELDEICQGK